MEDTESVYKSIKEVYCPYFKEQVHFTRIGFEHLKLKSKFRARSSKDREMRMRSLPLALKIISQSHTVQGKSHRHRFEERYVNSRKENVLTWVHYYEFIAVIDNKKAKVIIKQIENGDKLFLSVIPLFKQKMPPAESDIL